MVKAKIDLSLFFAMLGLVTIGFIMIFSTSYISGLTNFNDSYYYIKKHFVYLLIGFAGMLVALKIPCTFYKKYALLGLVFSNILLLLTLVPGIGVKLGGANRWINLGFIQLQPIEVTKFFISVYLASFLENKKDKMHSFSQGIIPMLSIVLISVLCLALQPDLGNAVLLITVAFILLFMAKTKIKHLAVLVLGGLSMVIVNVLTHPYQLGRIKTFLSPWEDPMGHSYHIVQSLIAIGSGGFFGQGIGQSKLKFFYLPLHYSDFIFSILCEEGGMILASIVILLFGVLFYRGLKIAIRQQSLFSMYLAMALVLFVVLQALINMGMVIGLLPVTGIPLTYVSFGGTSLVISMFFMGVVLNISRGIVK
jgi:cell division protein FtsW